MTQNSSESQLQTLERWRAMELEQAQSEHASLAQAEEQRKARVEKAQAQFEETQDFARASISSSQPLSADSLLRIADFAKLQVREVEDARSAWQQAQQTTAQAHERVVQQLENLSIVERLRERRAALEQQDALRMDQRRLDEHALSRLAAEREVDRSTKRKD
jgi:hypothetical protein